MILQRPAAYHSETYSIRPRQGPVVVNILRYDHITTADNYCKHKTNVYELSKYWHTNTRSAPLLEHYHTTMSISVLRSGNAFLGGISPAGPALLPFCLFGLDTIGRIKCACRALPPRTPVAYKQRATANPPRREPRYRLPVPPACSAAQSFTQEHPVSPQHPTMAQQLTLISIVLSIHAVVIRLHPEPPWGPGRFYYGPKLLPIDRDDDGASPSQSWACPSVSWEAPRRLDSDQSLDESQRLNILLVQYSRSRKS